MRLSHVTTYARRVIVKKGYHWEIVVGKTPVITCSRVSCFRYRRSTPISTELHRAHTQMYPHQIELFIARQRGETKNKPSICLESY
jgi:hypothetical protein